MRSLEGGDWKSTYKSNSLVAYPTSRPVLKPSMGATSMLRLTVSTHFF